MYAKQGSSVIYKVGAPDFELIYFIARTYNFFYCVITLADIMI